MNISDKLNKIHYIRIEYTLTVLKFFSKVFSKCLTKSLTFSSIFDTLTILFTSASLHIPLYNRS